MNFYRSILLLLPVLLCSSPLRAQQQDMTARLWNMLPAGLRTCVDNQLRQEQGTNLDALITAGVRPIQGS
ncbi:hypothetical protein ACVIWV_007699 [Bradyrhizobium diazoefficiens]